MPDTILEPPPHTVPAVFTRALLDWLPWLEPLAVESLTERHTGRAWSMPRGRNRRISACWRATPTRCGPAR